MLRDAMPGDHFRVGVGKDPRAQGTMISILIASSQPVWGVCHSYTL